VRSRAAEHLQGAAAVDAEVALTVRHGVAGPRSSPSPRRRCSGSPPLRNPMTGIAGCCARAANGHATAAPPSSVMNWRRPIIRSPRRRGSGTLQAYRD
jgi:hypothetical protein